MSRQRAYTASLWHAFEMCRGGGGDTEPCKRDKIHTDQSSQSRRLALDDGEGGRKEGTQTVGPHPHADASFPRSFACQKRCLVVR